MDNMKIYDKVREVPREAQKKINGGRMNGKTDINPMWRIRALTENFGPCGIGWYYDITNKWLEPGSDGEVAAFAEIALYIKEDGEWSKPIVGIGGNSFVTKERSGFYTSDECYKMALTDAISVACKALGFGADIYWETDPTKYDRFKPAAKKEDAEEPKEYKCCDCGKEFAAFTDKSGKTWSAGQVYHMAESSNTDGKARCRDCAVKSGTRKDK
jgi:DNA-directed RNA polymerase subunit RPC12/RpoP